MDGNKFFKIGFIVLLFAAVIYIIGMFKSGAYMHPKFYGRLTEQKVCGSNDSSITVQPANSVEQVFLSESKDGVDVIVTVTYNADSLTKDQNVFIDWTKIIDKHIGDVTVSELDPKQFKDNNEWVTYIGTKYDVKLLPKIVEIFYEGNKDHNVMTKITVCIPSYNKFQMSLNNPLNESHPKDSVKK